MIEALRGLGYTEQAAHYTHFSYEMVALTPRCALELGYEVSEEDRARPYIEVSGRKGFGVKADDLIDKLIAATRAEVDSRHPELSRGRTRGNGSRHCCGRAALLHAALHAELRDRLRFQGRAQLRRRDRTVSAIRGGADAEHLPQSGNHGGRGAGFAGGRGSCAVSQRRGHRGHLGSVAARGQDARCCSTSAFRRRSRPTWRNMLSSWRRTSAISTGCTTSSARRIRRGRSCCWRLRRLRSGSWSGRWRGWASVRRR